MHSHIVPITNTYIACLALALTDAVPLYTYCIVDAKPHKQLFEFDIILFSSYCANTGHNFFLVIMATKRKTDMDIPEEESDTLLIRPL